VLGWKLSRKKCGENSEKCPLPGARIVPDCVAKHKREAHRRNLFLASSRHQKSSPEPIDVQAQTAPGSVVESNADRKRPFLAVIPGWRPNSMHAKLVQERLRHSDITLTLGTDSHITPSMQRAAAETMQGILKVTRS
jgi:hypothetical protein